MRCTFIQSPDSIHYTQTRATILSQVGTVHRTFCSVTIPRDSLRYNSPVNERPPRPQRAEPREVVELKQLKVDQPELAEAVDMQVALVDMQRRVQSRVPLPWIQVDPDWLLAQQTAGRPVVRFRDIPLEWSDFRLTFRQAADILQRFDAMERAD